MLRQARGSPPRTTPVAGRQSTPSLPPLSTLCLSPPPSLCPSTHLCEYAANAPEVDGRGVLGKEASTQLWGTIPDQGWRGGQASGLGVSGGLARFTVGRLSPAAPCAPTPHALPRTLSLPPSPLSPPSSPSCCDVVSPEDGGGHVVEGRASQAKVTDLELAVCVGQDVLGLQIAVEHLGCGTRVGWGRHQRGGRR